MGIKYMERKFLWDNYKFVLILCVVLGHYISYYTEDSENMKRLFFLLYTFHMPAFIFVSGIFSKKIINEKRWTKVIDYFIMYLFIKGLLTISAELNGESSTFWIFRTGGVDWYAFAIMVFLVISMVTCHYKPKFVLLFSIFVGCLSGYHSYDGDFFVIQRILVFYPFFYLGYLMDPDKIEAIVKKKPIKILSFLIIIMMIIIIWLNINKLNEFLPLLTGRNPYSTLGEYEKIGGVLRAGYYIIVLIINFSLIALIPAGKSIISILGKHTMPVYVLHRAVIYFFMGIFGGGTFINNNFPNHPGIVLVIAATLTTIALSLPFWDNCLKHILHPKWNIFITKNVIEKK